MANKKVRRIPSKRINTYLAKTNAKLKQEDKISLRIVAVKMEIEKARETNQSKFVILMHENKLRKLQSDLLRVQSQRVKVQRMLIASTDRNITLNGDDKSEEDGPTKE